MLEISNSLSSWHCNSYNLPVKTQNNNSILNDFSFRDELNSDIWFDIR